MIRHYQYHQLKNIDPRWHFNPPVLHSIWELSPYEISKFSGELFQVMADAAQNYIYQKSLAAIRKEFQQRLTQNQNPS
jgi:hypothetical protein